MSIHPVSIHALLAECDIAEWDFALLEEVSIHALLAECDWVCRPADAESDVSIHALLAECDPPGPSMGNNQDAVSIHALLAECDRYGWPLQHHLWVSIHALLAECDRSGPSRSRKGGSFNPRTPCGVRQDVVGRDGKVYQFQSTHSLRSATGFQVAFSPAMEVSIHALLAECDLVPGRYSSPT